MGADANIRQLIEAVKRHPGSPAYAKLAEHYLEQGSLDQALKVCQEGFAVNPSYERGALVFLAVLRRIRDPSTASVVFSRAVAYVPRSAQLRVVWAMILAEAGRDQEARQFAREAMDLSPLNSEARALLATLGGTPSTKPSDSEEIPLGSPAAQGSLEEQASGQRASMRPRIRPVGQRTTAHQLFDLTPGPKIVGGRPGVKDSPFDITPMPMLADMSDAVEAIEDSPPSSPPSPQIPQAPPIPPPQAASQPYATPPPSPSPPETTDMVRPLIKLAQLPKEAAVRRSRPVTWMIVVLICLGALGAGGYYAHRIIKDREIRRAIDQAIQLTDPDTPEMYSRARDQLVKLESEYPGEARILSALVLVNAHLAVRFHTNASAVKKVQQAIDQLGSNTDKKPRLRAAIALIDLHAGKSKTALSLVHGSTQASSDWHTSLTIILAALMLQDVDLARKKLEAMLLASPSAAALFYEGALLYRRSGQLDLSRRLISQGLKISPAHAGLRIQQALIGELEDKPVSPKEIVDLEQAAAAIPRYLSEVALLKGLRAVEKGKQLEAILLAKVALQETNNASPELGAWLGVWQMRQGGDAVQALKQLQQFAPRMSAYHPAMILWLAKAQLLVGRPHDAHTALMKIPQERLGEADKRWLEVLEVRCAHLTDDLKTLDRRCSKAGPWIRENPGRCVACVEALLARSRIKHAEILIQSLNNVSLVRYLQGQRALALGDAAKAIALLSPLAKEDDVMPLAQPGLQLALARAHSQLGQASQAIPILRKAVEMDANSIRTKVDLATNLVAAGHDTEALSILDVIIAAKPSQPSILGQSGQAFLDLGLPSKAQIVILQALKFSAESTSIRMLAGRVALANNRLKEAATMFNMVLKKEPNSPEALVELGRIMAAQNKQKRARQYFARAVKLRPKDPELLLRLSHALAQSGNYKKSLTFGLEAIELLHQSNRSQRVQEALVALGKSLKGGNRWARQRAEEVFFEATKSSSAHASAFYELGILHRQNKDLNRAVWCLRQATIRDPAMADAFWELGRTLSKKKKWQKDAKKALLKFLKLRPQGDKGARARSLLKRLK